MNLLVCSFIILLSTDRPEKVSRDRAILRDCAWQQAIGDKFLLVGKCRIKLLGGI